MKTRFLATLALLLTLTITTNAAIYLIAVSTNANTSKNFGGYLTSPDQGRIISASVYKWNPAEEPGFQWESYQTDIIESSGNFYWFWTSTTLTPGDYYVSFATITSHIEYTFTAP